MRLHAVFWICWQSAMLASAAAAANCSRDAVNDECITFVQRAKYLVVHQHTDTNQSRAGPWQDHRSRGFITSLKKSLARPLQDPRFRRLHTSLQSWVDQFEDVAFRLGVDPLTSSRKLRKKNPPDVIGLEDILANAGPGVPNTSPEGVRILKSNSARFIDLFTCGLLVCVVAAVSVGACLSREKWVATMVTVSYAMLIPGLFSKDFSFNIAIRARDFVGAIPLIKLLDPFNVLVPQLPERIQVTSNHDVWGPIRESTRSFVGLLWRTGSHSGAMMIALFAFVVPMAKVLLLLMGERMRYSPKPMHVKASRWCILVVQFISKWASPDMFAFALLYYLMRTLNHPPVVETLMMFDIGYSCYNVFCAFSVVSTLLVTLPKLPEEEGMQARKAPLVWRWCGGKLGLVLLAVALTTAWVFLFIHGLLSPCLSMRLDLGIIWERQNLPESLLVLLGGSNLEDVVNTDVSIWRATIGMMDWFRESGEMTLLLGSCMFVVFGISITILDMAFLLASALAVEGTADSTSKQADALSGRMRFARRAIQATEFFKHLAMLDVCVVGVLIVSACAGIYHREGVFIKHVWGVWVLLGSEIVHYVTYYTISTVVAGLVDDDAPHERPKS